MTTIAPHGGTLVNRLTEGEEGRTLLEGLARLPVITLDPRTTADLELIATGGYSPLTGFMGLADYRGVIHEMRLAGGFAWPMPITLRVGDAADLRGTVALAAPDGARLGVLEVREVYTADKHEEAQLVFGTTDAGHPGVAHLYAQGAYLVGGEVRLLRRTAPAFHVSSEMASSALPLLQSFHPTHSTALASSGSRASSISCARRYNSRLSLTCRSR